MKLSRGILLLSAADGRSKRATKNKVSEIFTLIRHVIPSMEGRGDQNNIIPDIRDWPTGKIGLKYRLSVKMTMLRENSYIVETDKSLLVITVFWWSLMVFQKIAYTYGWFKTI